MSQNLDKNPQISVSNSESSQSSNSQQFPLHDLPNSLGSLPTVDSQPIPQSLGLKDLDIFKAPLLENRNTDKSA